MLTTKPGSAQLLTTNPTNLDYWKGSQTSLQAVCKQLLKNQRLLIASNRGPVTYNLDNEGNLVPARGSGGVVTALSTLTRHAPVIWVAAALNKFDRQLAAQGYLELERNLRLRLVDIPSQSFEKYLNVISNPLLWFLQHNQLEMLQGQSNFDWDEIDIAWQEGYVVANKAFATQLLNEIRTKGTAPLVILHDYQLYLTPGIVRKYNPQVKLVHFTHIPWPKPEVWSALPEPILHSICRSLLACDISGFQTNQDAANFVATCQAVLADVQVEQTDIGRFTVQSRFNFQRPVYVNTYPISIDPQAVRGVYLSQAAQNWRTKLSELCSSSQDAKPEHKLIVRVDRLDPAKNILSGFEVYEELLAKYPDWQGKVTFLALLVPTRETLSEYNAYKELVFSTIERINMRFGTANWQPIYKTYNNNYTRALAALSLADVVMINSVADGMNLIAKETAIVNEKAAVLLLSSRAGAWHELKEYALGVEPTDQKATLQALYQALTMSEEERLLRFRGLAEQVETNNLSRWLTSQLLDLANLSSASEGNDLEKDYFLASTS